MNKYWDYKCIRHLEGIYIGGNRGILFSSIQTGMKASIMVYRSHTVLSSPAAHLHPLPLITEISFSE